MDGRTIIRWSQWLSGPYCARVADAALNEGALRAYESVRGVPECIVASAIAPANAEEAEALAREFADPRAGYVPDGGVAEVMAGAGPSDGDAVPRRPVPDVSASAGEREAGVSGVMAGLVDVEIVLPPVTPVGEVGAVREETVREALDVVRGGGVVATSTSGRIASDFDPYYFVKTHPVSFPHGAGAVPKGMGLATYSRILVERMLGRPAAEGGEDVMLILSLFNVLQRHAALAETRGRMQGNPDDFVRLDALTDDDFARMYRAVSTGLYPIRKRQKTTTTTFGARSLAMLAMRFWRIVVYHTILDTENPV